MHDEHEHAQPRPEGETRPVSGAETHTQVEERNLTGFAIDLGTLVLAGGATSVGLKGGADLYDGAKAKVQDALKPEPSRVVLPPDVEE